MISTRGRAGEPGDVELGFLRVSLQRFPVIDDAVGIDNAKNAVRAALKGLNAQRIGFRDFARRIDLVVQHDKHAFAARVAGRCDTECIQQIRRALISGRSGAPHRPHDDDGFGRSNGQMEEIGQLFEGVRSRRDDSAREVWVSFEDVIDPFRQLNPLIQRHRGAGDIRELLRFGPGVSLQAGYQLQHLFGAHPGAAACGDRAAGCDKSDAGKLVVGPCIDASDDTEHKDGDHQGEGGRFCKWAKHAR